MQLRDLVDELQTPAANNALMIRARANDSIIGVDQVKKCLQQARAMPTRSVVSAHILHNGGRFFIAKNKTREDKLEAQALFLEAIARYALDGDKVLHHLAAAYHWLNEALNLLGYEEAAFKAQRTSVDLWEEAHQADPENKVYRDRWAAALRKLADCISK